MAQMNRVITRNALALATAALLATATGSAVAQDPGLDQQAREAAWAGRVGDGLRLMDRYLVDHPDDAAAKLDRARFLAWRGDYAAAIEALDALGEDSADARALRARVYAWAGRRDRALELNTPIYQADSAAYDPAFTQALASRLGEAPQEALPALAAVQAAKPDGKDTRDLARAVRLPLFSGVGLPVSAYSDSDDIEIRSVGLEGRLRVSDRWTLLGDAARREHSAPAAGPFAPVTGGSSVDENRLLVGARLSLSPTTALEFAVGRSELDPGDGATVGRVEWTQRTSDAFLYRLRAERDRVIASPRAVSLGILREGATLMGEARPNLRDLVRADATVERLTDGNRHVAVNADYRHATYRSERINLDLGAQAEWQSFSSDPGNGYYSPDRYMRIAPLAAAYVKLGDDAGLFLQAAVGVQRDETFDSWKRASDVSAELTLGVFSHWQLVARAGYSERLNEFGRYEGFNAGLTLRYRFCEFDAARCPDNAGP